MKPVRIVHESGNYRICEYIDECSSIEDLKGDTYNPKVNPEIDPKLLKVDEEHFEWKATNYGVFGYSLETRCSDPDCGSWKTVDSCWGFVGQYDPNEEFLNHYIIDELKGQIK